MKYKLSKYNCVKVGEKVAICNTFSRGIAVLERAEYTRLQQISESCEEDDTIREWFKQGFIVDVDKDEIEIVNHCRYRDTFLKNRPIYRILTTSACNARCFYCYEKGRPDHTMTNQIACKTANFIIRSAKDANGLTLNWFGGDPLLNPNAITLITQKIITAFDDKKVNSTIITNASLFSKELRQLAKSTWNVSRIQVSLDGFKETHERRKAYVNYNDSFEKTIETIGLLLSDGFHVSLRLNYDKGNYNEIKELIYFIKETYRSPLNLTCYTYPLFNTFSCKESLYIKTDDIPLYESIMKRALAECGYYNPLKIPSQRTTACFATDPDSCVINTDGQLYKCTMDMSANSNSVGNVNDGYNYGRSMVKWTTPDLPEQCQDCIMLPICQGGCRADRLLKINMNDCAIKKQAIEYTLNHILNHYKS